jgi:hypothetical protein
VGTRIHFREDEAVSRKVRQQPSTDERQARSVRRAVGQKLLFVVTCLAAACSGDDAPSGAPDSSVTRPAVIAGVIQKGPFVHGTVVTVQELDEQLAPTGRSFNVASNDDLGGFQVPIHLTARFVEVVATGYYYDELRDELSSGTLTLRSISDVLTDGKVDVNLLTTVTAPLLRGLVGQGQSFADARQHAETTVLDALGFTPQVAVTFDKLDVAAAGADNAVLLAASLVLEKYAESLGGSEVAELTQLVSQISAALSDGGSDAIALANLRAARCRIAGTIDTAGVRAHLVHHYASFGVTVTIPPFEPLIADAAALCADAGADAQGDGGARADADDHRDVSTDGAADRADVDGRRDVSVDGSVSGDALSDAAGDASQTLPEGATDGPDDGGLPGFVTCGATGRFVYFAPPDFEIDAVDINNNGEIVWAEMKGGTDAASRIRSSVRGTLASMGLGLGSPRINDSGKTVWQTAITATQSTTTVVVDGITITPPGLFDFCPEVTNSGEVLWIRGETLSATRRLNSSTRGVLTPPSEDVYAAPFGANQSGEVAYARNANVDGSWVIEIASTTRGVIGEGGQEPDINDAGEIVWVSFAGDRIRSSTRGDLGIGHHSPRINSNGDVAWTAYVDNRGIPVVGAGSGGRFVVFMRKGGVLRVVESGYQDAELSGLGLNDHGALAFGASIRTSPNVYRWGVFVASCEGGVPFDAGAD